MSMGPWVEQIEIGEIARQQRRIGKTDIFVVRRDTRHGDGALRELCDAIALTSLVETTAWRRPTSTRSPTSSPSERSDSSTRPSRTSTLAKCCAPRPRLRVRARAFGGLNETLRQR